MLAMSSVQQLLFHARGGTVLRADGSMRADGSNGQLGAGLTNSGLRDKGGMAFNHHLDALARSPGTVSAASAATSSAASAATVAAATASAATAAAGKVLPALRNAAERTGVDFSFLFHTARLESSFRPDAKATTSSATGLFQFIESTWLSTLRKHGTSHGIHPSSRAEALQLRSNPAVASLMAAEHAADNASRLQEGLGRKATSSDLYLAHFLGSGGAVRFLQGLATNPAMAAADMLPAAARANKAIFFKAGAPRSLQGVHDLLVARFTGNSAASPSAAPVAVASAVAPTPRPSPIAPMQARSQSVVPHPFLDRLNHAAGTWETDAIHAPPEVDARRAAQAAYLLLAELGV